MQSKKSFEVTAKSRLTNSMKKSKIATLIICVAVAVMLLFGLYMLGYYMMLEGVELAQSNRHWPQSWLKHNETTMVPIYAEKSGLTQTIFWPAHQIDRIVRRNHWPQ